MHPGVSGTGAVTLVVLFSGYVCVRVGRCMGLFGVVLFVIGLWVWNWAILNLEDESDILRGSSNSHEDRLEAKQVWTGAHESDWLVDSIYQRILDPRIPSDFTFVRHPAPEQERDGTQG